jgi:hypothetical protein
MHLIKAIYYNGKFAPKSFARLAAAMFALAMLLASVRGEKARSETGVKTAPVNLTVATVLSSKDILAFTMKNTGNKPIQVNGPETSPCKFVFINPNGKSVKFTSSVGPLGVGSAPLLQPGESKRWDVNISEYFGRDYFGKDMTKKGIYRLTWVYEYMGIEERVSEVISNEMLILKNEDSPKINRDTGAPE